jgi:hypothetical protein
MREMGERGFSKSKKAEEEASRRVKTQESRVKSQPTQESSRN